MPNNGYEIFFFLKNQIKSWMICIQWNYLKIWYAKKYSKLKVLFKIYFLLIIKRFSLFAFYKRKSEEKALYI